MMGTDRVKYRSERHWRGVDQSCVGKKCTGRELYRKETLWHRDAPLGQAKKQPRIAVRGLREEVKRIREYLRSRYHSVIVFVNIILLEVVGQFKKRPR